LLLALLLVTGSHGARILGVFPFPAKSHMIIPRVLMLELAGRGHQVTEVTPFLETKMVPNYTQIEVKGDFLQITGGTCKRTLAGNGTLGWSEIYSFSIVCDVDFVLC
jgi:glucuronosyltransferase